jgi:beta-glucanase (GH16 family)
VTANAAQWHTLGVIWSPGEVQYTIDGSVWATESNPNVSTVPMNIVLQSQTDCEAVTGQTCSVPWAATEPNVDVDWIVAYTHK